MESKVKVGEYIFDFAANELHRGKTTKRLPQRLSILLNILVENAGEPVTRDVLIDTIWQQKIVNEDALSRCVTELRSLLNDNKQQPLYIETLPKVGYRLVANVSEPDVPNTQLKHKWIASIAVCVVFLGLISLFWSPSKFDIDLANSLNNVERLTTTAQIEAQAQISPSGNLLSYAYFNHTEKYFAVNVMDKTGKVLHELKSSEANLLSPAFSMDENAIFVAKVMQQECKIVEFTLPSLNQRELFSCAIPPYRGGLMEWSGNDADFAYVNNNLHQRNTAIWLYSRESNEHKQITFPQPNQYDTRPRISPDNQYLTFLRYDNKFSQIITVSLSNIEHQEVLLSEPYPIVSHDWLDTNRIVFDSERRGERYLWTLNIQDKSLQIVGGKNALFPSVDDNSKTLLLQEVEHQSQIWLVDKSDNSETQLTQSPGINEGPAFSRGGNAFAYSSKREGYQSIWLFDFETGKEQELFDMPDTNIHSPDWSLDDKSILVTAQDSENQGCIVFNLKERSINVIPSDEIDIAYCRFGSEDKIFAKANEAQNGLYVFTENNGWELVTSDVIYFSPLDDGRIVIDKIGDSGLFIVDLLGNEQHILQDKPEIEWAIWKSHNTSLYFTQMMSKPGTWKVDLTSLQWQKWSDTQTMYVNQNAFDVAANGNRLLITRISRKEGDLYITELQ